MYFELASTIAKLSGEQIKRLLLDMCAYAETGRTPDYSDDLPLDLIWGLCKARLDADAERYDLTVQRRKEAVNKRWEQAQTEKKSDVLPPYRSKYAQKQTVPPDVEATNKYLNF